MSDTIDRSPRFIVDDTTPIETKISAGTIRRADIAYVIDCTGTMDGPVSEGEIPLISSVKESLGECIKFYEQKDIDVRLALTEFRDRQNLLDLKLYERPLLKHYEWSMSRFTKDFVAFMGEVEGLRAVGGGSVQESILDALVTTAEECDWEEGSTRVIVLFSDAHPRRTDISVKTVNEGIERLQACNIDQIHLCINMNKYKQKFRRFRQLMTPSAGKGAVTFHNIMQPSQSSLIELLKKVHKGSVERITSSRLGFRRSKKSLIPQTPKWLNTKTQTKESSGESKSDSSTPSRMSFRRNRE